MKMKSDDTGLKTTLVVAPGPHRGLPSSTNSFASDKGPDLVVFAE